MSRRFALPLILALAALAPAAHANGRPPGTSTIHFRQGHPQDVVAGMTFGLALSHDGGSTWRWMCEKAVGYGGMYDPDYAYSASGALFATTFDGLKVNRDACVFAPTPEGTKFVSTDTLGPDGHVHFAASDPADGKIYASADDGVTFPVALQSMPGQLNDWWQSLEVAPSDGQRLYLSGYRLPAGGSKMFLFFKSTTSGASWDPVSLTGVATMPNSTIDIVGISATDPNLLYIRVDLEDNSTSDALYRSTDGGGTWTPILHGTGTLPGFVVRANGDLVVGTQTAGAKVSHDRGTTWTDLTSPPHINCLVESDGAVWACTQNYGGPGLPSDNAGIMKSTDLVTWTPVLKYQDLLEPVSCPAGTDQHDTCDAMWCAFCAQIGCTPNRQCATTDDAGNTISDAGPVTPPTSKGSCDAGTGGATGLLVLGGIAVVFLSPRRRRSII